MILFLRISIYTIVLLGISSCELTKKTQRYQTREVHIGHLESNDRIRLASVDRLKVAKITVNAPRKGTKVLGMEATTTSRGLGHNSASWENAVTYVLQEDFEDEVQNVMAQLFKLDPNSDKTAIVNVKPKIDGYYGGRGWCHDWKTTTKFDLTIKILMRGVALSEIQRDSEIENSHCALDIFMSGDSIGEDLQKGLRSSIEEILKDGSFQRMVHQAATKSRQ